MVENMCMEYGERIAVVDGEMYHAFPTIESLAGNLVFNLFTFELFIIFLFFNIFAILWKILSFGFANFRSLGENC